MSSAAKQINKSDMTTPKGDEGGGARETPASKGFAPKYEERVGPAPGGDKGWTGGYSDSGWMGNPAIMADRQFASAGAPYYHDEVNIAYPCNDPEAEIYMVPDFQEQSGQGANQSTLRPIGSV